MVEKVAIKANIFCLFFLAAASLAWAHIADFDEHWQKREEHAKRVALESYHPNPEEVTTHLNHHVHLAVEHDIANNTNARRGLRGRRKVAGPCEATNPIDQCWRCRPNWADERKRLAQCVLGFGRNTTGGLEGNFYVVTDSSDNDMVNPKPGTLRHAVIQTEPLWIIFASDMSIRLSQELMITSNKTIDARGAIVHITTGAGITIQYAQNVIIHGLRIHDIHQGTGGEIRDSVHHKGHRTMSDGDGISIFGSSNVWLDHISLSRCRDGLIDVIQGSTAITISNTHMTEHNDVLLFGAHDKYSEDKLMQITVAFNHFGKGLTQRMPRCRHGYFHVVNNDYTHWLMYAIGGSANPTIISEGNRFIAPNVQNAKEVTHRDVKKFPEWVNWKWTSTGDVFQNGAFFVPSGAPEVDTHSSQDKISFKTGEFASRLTRYAGSLKCRVGKPC